MGDGDRGDERASRLATALTKLRTQEAERQRNAPSEDYLRHLVWASKDYWTHHESAALIAGLDPNVWKGLEHTDTGSVPISDIEAISTYKDVLELCDKAHSQRVIYYRNKPLEFVRWIKSLGYEVPEELSELVGDSIMYLDGGVQSEEVRGQPSEYGSCSEEERPVSTRQRNTFLKLILVAAWDGYGHRPGLRTDAVAQLVDATVRLGLPISKQTITDYLNEALEEFGSPCEMD